VRPPGGRAPRDSGRERCSARVADDVPLRAAGWMVGLDRPASAAPGARQQWRPARRCRYAVRSAIAGWSSRPRWRTSSSCPSQRCRGTIRNRPAALAGALGAMSGVLSKIAFDVVLLSQRGWRVARGAARGVERPRRRPRSATRSVP
jgi:hypothetical protein